MKAFLISVAFVVSSVGASNWVPLATNSYGGVDRKVAGNTVPQKMKECALGLVTSQLQEEAKHNPYVTDPGRWKLTSRDLFVLFGVRGKVERLEHFGPADMGQVSRRVYPGEYFFLKRLSQGTYNALLSDTWKEPTFFQNKTVDTENPDGYLRLVKSEDEGADYTHVLPFADQWTLQAYVPSDAKATEWILVTVKAHLKFRFVDVVFTTRSPNDPNVKKTGVYCEFDQSYAGIRDVTDYEKAEAAEVVKIMLKTGPMKYENPWKGANQTLINADYVWKDPLAILEHVRSKYSASNQKAHHSNFILETSLSGGVLRDAVVDEFDGDRLDGTKNIQGRAREKIAKFYFHELKNLWHLERAGDLQFDTDDTFVDLARQHRSEYLVWTDALAKPY